MINITIAENGTPSSEVIKLGNEFENLDEVIQFTFPKDLESLHKYVVAKTYDPKKKENITRVTPLVNNRFVVGSAITKVTGTWVLYTLCKSYAVNEDGNTINTERVSISDPIIAVVNENDIDIGAIEKVELDPNIKIIYDELISFKKELESNEATRQTNEEARVNAENGRVSAETARVSEEQARQKNEAQRAENEANRKNAETVRASAEAERISNEKTRKANEALRVNAEGTRANAENERIKNESERVTAETVRQEAEANREGTINKIREDVDTNTKNIGITERSLSALWDLNNGISYRFETDSEKAYKKQIPSGAKLGAVNKISGRTIVYNQLFKTDNIDNGSITITYADNIVTINGTASNNWINFSTLDEKLNVVGKFYIKMIIIKNDDGLSFEYGWLNRSVGTDSITSGSASAICSQTSSDLEKGLSTGISWAENTGSVTFNDVKIQITIVNLTKMFGEGNEPTTTEEFESMFPNSYYPYNEGELMSMSVNEVEEVGKNIFKCENFSCYGLYGTDKPSLSNSYGTSINNTEPSNSVTVTQSSVGEENINTSYENGYFCVSFKPFVLSEDYMFSFDVIPSKK